MIRMIARKRMTYNHRSLSAGDEFDVATDLHAAVLEVHRRARRRVATADVPAAPVPVQNAVDETRELDLLRDRARSAGIEVDGRWGPRRLKAEIDARSR